MTTAENDSRPSVDRQNGSRPSVEGKNGSRPRLGVLISGRGSNLQSIIDAISAGELSASIAVVISNRGDAPGLQRARDATI
jgi:formyltetrahydrofolate hydrolase